MIQMIKIALEVENNLKILLEENFSYEFFDVKDLKIKEIVDKNIGIAIIDNSVIDLEDRLTQYKNYNIKVILLATVFDIFTLRKFVKEDLICDFLNKKDYTFIEEIIASLKEKSSKKSKIYVDDSFVKVLIYPMEILYIIYSRYIRKSVIKLGNGKEYYSKKNLMEIEVMLSSYPEFIRIERSSIININRIKEINIKKESIIFDSDDVLQLSKRILKNLEFKWFNEDDIIKL